MKEYLQRQYNFQDISYLHAIDDVPQWSSAFGQVLLEYIPYIPEMTVLDIGCGTGYPLLEIAMRLGERSKLYGLDPWNEALERITYKMQHQHISNVELLNGVGEEIPLSDGVIDLVTSNNGISNVQDINKCIKECHRVLKTNGRIAMTFNLNKTMKQFYKILGNILAEKEMREAQEQMNLHINQKRLPIDEISEKLKLNGFHVNQIVKEKYNYYFIDGKSFFQHHLINMAFLPEWKKLIKEDMQDEIFGEVERRLNVLAECKSPLKISIPFVYMDAVKE